MARKLSVCLEQWFPVIVRTHSERDPFNFLEVVRTFGRIPVGLTGRELITEAGSVVDHLCTNGYLVAEETTQLCTYFGEQFNNRNLVTNDLFLDLATKINMAEQARQGNGGDGGSVIIIAGQVVNGGTISARGGDGLSGGKGGKIEIQVREGSANFDCLDVSGGKSTVALNDLISAIGELECDGNEKERLIAGLSERSGDHGSVRAYIADHVLPFLSLQNVANVAQVTQLALMIAGI